MQYAINYSSKKKSHIVFTENICLKKQNKTNKKKKNKWLLENRILIFNTPQDVYKEVKKFFLSIKTRTKWDEIMIVIFQEKKNQKMENIFLCLCMLCINQIFFWSSLRGSNLHSFGWKITLLSFQCFGCIFYTSDQKLKKKPSAAFLKLFLLVMYLPRA